MLEYTHSQAKKSVYLFLSLLLGIFLFLVMHRLVVFLVIMFYLFSGGAGIYAIQYRQFLLLDYSTLILAVIGGSWYGLWVGGYWYEKVYESGFHGGAVGHLIVGLKRFVKKQSTLKQQVEKISSELSEEAWQLENLVELAPKKPVLKKSPKRRGVPKKLTRKKHDL